MLPLMADANPQAIRHHLERLISSEQLEKSESASKLLRYLVERALHGEAPKEAEIAIDVFRPRRLVQWSRRVGSPGRGAYAAPQAGRVLQRTWPAG